MSRLLSAQDGDAALVEAVWVFLGGDVEVDGEDEIRPCEVQVHGKSHLQQQGIKCASGNSERKTDHERTNVFLFSYHVSLLGCALFDPSQVSERQLSGDGGGQRQLVVGTSGSLEFQTWNTQ